jgi:hypothetical protein
MSCTSAAARINLRSRITRVVESLSDAHGCVGDGAAMSCHGRRHVQTVVQQRRALRRGKYPAALQPVGHAPVILGQIHVLVDEFVDYGNIDSVLFPLREQSTQAALRMPFQNVADMMTADERRMAAPSPERRMANRGRSGREGLHEVANGCRPHERDVHRQDEKCVGARIQARHAGRYRGEHPLFIVGVYDAAGAPSVDQGGHLRRAVADYDMDAVDPGGLKQPDDPLQNRHPAEHHQRLEIAHALRKSG